ncbi:MAG TPA: heme-binding protein [Tepidisphaeraceae bacterium]|nr:heme-binding protein [Tepidisphaeraceae bacterium]
MNRKTTRIAVATFVAAAGLALGLGQMPTRAGDAPKTITKQPAKAIQTTDISLDQAHAILAAATAKAAEINTKMDIAVVDAGGNLKAFARMDGAWIGSIDISIKKAKTARFFDMPTGEIGKLSQPGGPLWNIEVSNGGLITFPGGVPIKGADGTIIGAIGVSGSTVENDHTVAAAGAAAVK